MAADTRAVYRPHRENTSRGLLRRAALPEEEKPIDAG
jgi:hypothetical protein